MNIKTDKYADALRLIQLMNYDHQLVEDACLSLGISKSDFAQLRTQQQMSEETITDDLEYAESNVEQFEKKFDKPNILPKLSRNEKWQFLITYFSHYQKKNNTLKPLINELLRTSPHELTKCEDTNRSENTPPVNNKKLFWKKLLKQLGFFHISNQVDDNKLIKKIAQKSIITKLPFKQRTQVNKSVWLYIDQSESNYPLYSDFNHFIQQLYRHVGRSNIDNIIEITDFRAPCHWRIRTSSGKLTKQQKGLLPVPNGHQQVIVIGAPENFKKISRGHWIKRLARYSSRFVQVTTIQEAISQAKSKNNGLYFGHLSDLSLAKQQATQLSVNYDDSAKEQLLAILSVTPARFTLAMLRELRQKVTGGSLNIESQLFSQSILSWQRFTDNGYWDKPDIKYRNAFASLPNKVQINAIDIIKTHLPDTAPSLGHEMFLLLPQLVGEELKDIYQEQFRKAVISMKEISSKLLTNNKEPLKNANYLDYLYKMSERFGDNAIALPTEANDTLTIMYKQALNLHLNIVLPKGFNEELKDEMDQDQGQVAIPGKLIQNGSLWNVTDNEKYQGLLLAELDDISQIIISIDKAKQKLCLSREQPYKLSNNTKVVQGNTLRETFIFEMIDSQQLYWAKTLSVDEEGITATAEGIKVYWSVNKIRFQQNKTEDATKKQYQRAVVTVVDDAPSWLKENTPELDEYGLFVKIPIGSTYLTLRYIPSGSFIMGSPLTETGHQSDETQKQVTLGQSFWLSSQALSLGQFRTIMEDTQKLAQERSIWELRGTPIQNLDPTIYEYLYYCKQLYKKSGLITMFPSEAQWEYACRSGTNTAYWSGDNSTIGTHLSVNSASLRGPKHSEDFFPLNPWGLEQMHGNISEICLDTNKNESTIVLRGGNDRSSDIECRAASRDIYEVQSLEADMPMGMRICVVASNANLNKTALDTNEESESYFEDALAVFGHHSNEGSDHQNNNENEIDPKFINPDPLDLAEHNRQQRWQLRPPIEYPSSWTKSYGFDEFGLWQILSIKGQNLRFRYMTPGHHILGSSSNEINRDLDEEQMQNSLMTGFWLAETTVTHDLWQIVMGDSPSYFEEDAGGFLVDLPVENVSWSDCIKFCEALNKLAPGLHLSLPTEQQWEYACKADTATAFSSGDELSVEYGHCYYPNSIHAVLPVADLKPNPWGLKLMHGNVWEWCLDYYSDTITTTLTREIQNNSLRVIRGGSWLDKPQNCRSAFRHYAAPESKADNIGFRLCCNITGSKNQKLCNL